MSHSKYSARSSYNDTYEHITSYVWRNRIPCGFLFFIITGVTYLLIFTITDMKTVPAGEQQLLSDQIYRQAIVDFVQDERIKAHLDEPPLDADIRIDWSSVNNTLPLKAALVAVVRNGDLYSIRSTVRTIEDRWNHQYNYPWVFLSDQPLSSEFKHYTQMLSGAPMYYGLIDRREWSYPHWIDTRFAEIEMGRFAEMGLFRGGSLDFRLKSR